MRLAAGFAAVCVAWAYAGGPARQHEAQIMAVARDAGAVLCVLAAAGIMALAGWLATRQRWVTRVHDSDELDLSPLPSRPAAPPVAPPLPPRPAAPPVPVPARPERHLKLVKTEVKA